MLGMMNKASAAGAMYVALASCAVHDGATIADRAELKNIRPSNIIPKSTPSQFVGTFQDHCVNSATDQKTREAKLRDAGYVPTSAHVSGQPQFFLIDNTRPAVAVSDRMCVVKALSRTGQTEKVRDFVAKHFPDARSVEPKQFGSGIEESWLVPTNPPQIIATQRSTDKDQNSVFELVLYRHGAKST